MKIAGRDAGKICVVIDEKDDKVLVDGQTRRRAVNTAHLEPLKQTVEVKKKASHEEVVKALADIDIEVQEHQKQKDIVKSKQK